MKFPWSLEGTTPGLHLTLTRGSQFGKQHPERRQNGSLMCTFSESCGAKIHSEFTLWQELLLTVQTHLGWWHSKVGEVRPRTPAHGLYLCSSSAVCSPAPGCWSRWLWAALSCGTAAPPAKLGGVNHANNPICILAALGAQWGLAVGSGRAVPAGHRPLHCPLLLSQMVCTAFELLKHPLGTEKHQ